MRHPRNLHRAPFLPAHAHAHGRSRIPGRRRRGPQQRPRPHGTRLLPPLVGLGAADPELGHVGGGGGRGGRGWGWRRFGVLFARFRVRRVDEQGVEKVGCGVGEAVVGFAGPRGRRWRRDDGETVWGGREGGGVGGDDRVDAGVWSGEENVFAA